MWSTASKTLKKVETIEISLNPTTLAPTRTAFHDFSQQGIERRRDCGYERYAYATAQHFAAKTAA